MKINKIDSKKKKKKNRYNKDVTGGPVNTSDIQILPKETLKTIQINIILNTNFTNHLLLNLGYLKNLIS